MVAYDRLVYLLISITGERDISKGWWSERKDRSLPSGKRRWTQRLK
jgi:hypothetical protein